MASKRPPVTLPLVRSRSTVLVIAALALPGLSCKGNGPDTHLGGHVVVASGQPAPPGPIPVLLYATDPFAKNATPIMIAPTTGSTSNMTFEFPTSISQGDYYLVAWLDVGLDGQMDKGDYLGWANGDTTTAGAPAAAIVHKDHDSDRSVTITVSIVP
jgi:hypothetical protein